MLTLVLALAGYGLMNAQNWLTTGNSASSTDFLGTTNAQDLRFRTGNVQRMILTQGGFLGVGTSAPSALIQSTGTGTINLRLERTGSGNQNNGLNVWFTSNPLPSYALAGGSVNFVADATGLGDMSFSPDGATLPFIIKHNGNVSIGAGVSPSAVLHTNGTLRFQGLGQNNALTQILAIDANGNVAWRDAATLFVKATTETEQTGGSLNAKTRNDEIMQLNADLASLRQEMQALQAAYESCPCCKTGAVPGRAELFQNTPNPYTQSTLISYSLPESTGSAFIIIFDMAGTQISKTALTQKGNGNISINGGELAAGMYLYSLVADGKEIDTKRMILTK